MSLMLWFLHAYRLIRGFISKREAKECLQDEAVGSFLIRFSESDLESASHSQNQAASSSQKRERSGHLTVAVQQTDPETGDHTLDIKLNKL
jgi:hypothetical protein